MDSRHVVAAREVLRVMTTAVYYRGVLAIDSLRTRLVAADLKSMTTPSTGVASMKFTHEYTGESIDIPDAETTVATCKSRKLRVLPGEIREHGVVAIAASGRVSTIDAVYAGVLHTIESYTTGIAKSKLTTSDKWNTICELIDEYISGAYTRSIRSARASINAGHMPYDTWGMLIAGVDGALLLRGTSSGRVRVRSIPTDHPYPVIIGVGDDLVRYFMAHRGIFDDTKTTVPIAARMVAVCGHMFPNSVGGDTSYVDTSTIAGKMQVFTEADAATYVASLQMVTLDTQPEKA